MSPDHILKALAKLDAPVPEVTIVDTVARLRYPTMDAWSARVSADVDALRKSLRGLVETWSDEGQSATAADLVSSKSLVAPVLCLRFAK